MTPLALPFLCLLLLAFAHAAPVARGETPSCPPDSRIAEIRVRMREAETLLAGETNPVVRALADKRRQLLAQELSNTERRLSLEAREQERRRGQKTDPLGDLKASVLGARGNAEEARQRAHSLDAQYRQLRAERTRSGERLTQLRADAKADLRLLADIARQLRLKDERLTLILFQRQLADWQILLMQEAARLETRIDAMPASSKPTIRALLTQMREVRRADKQGADIQQRIADLRARQDDAAAGLALTQAKAAQLDEAIAIHKERERIEHGRPRFLPWSGADEEEKERAAILELLDLQEAQLQSAAQSLQVSSQVADLIDKEKAWLRFRRGILVQQFTESILFPAGCVLVLVLLHLLLTRLLFPLVYHHHELFAIRRNTGYLTALLVLLVLVRFFLEDLKDVGTVLGIAGAAVVIALQDLCSAFAGWFVIVASGKIRVGDRVEIAGARGDVIDIQLLRTTLNELHDWLGVDEPTGRVVVIPNSFIFKERVINYAHVHPFLWDRLNITVTFETPAAEARETLWAILTEETRESFDEARHAEPRMEKKYGVRDAVYVPKIVSSIDDSGVTFGLLYIIHYRKRMGMRNQLNVRILDAFARNSRIQFAYPTTRQIPTPEAGGFKVALEPRPPSPPA